MTFSLLESLLLTGQLPIHSCLQQADNRMSDFLAECKKRDLEAFGPRSREPKRKGDG